MLVARLRTFLAFPDWHHPGLPVNTMTEPRARAVPRRPADAAARTAMARTHDESRTEAGRPAHRYTLSDFGLTGEEVDERFAGGAT
jgi:hypothetical protein